MTKTNKITLQGLNSDILGINLVIHASWEQI